LRRVGISDRHVAHESQNGQEDEMSVQTKTLITHLHTASAFVSDQDRALDFYTGKLGFEKRTDIPLDEKMRWIEVAPPGAQTTIAIVPPFRPGQHVGSDTGVAFNTTDAEAALRDLRAHGVDTDSEVMQTEGPVPPMFTFRDPDGNTLTIVQGN
jgi:catechol 2,3-dioxygenase-like lactoylglutathione lyase family enzyme